MTATVDVDVETDEGPGGVGRVARVTGPVVDVEFPVESMPEIFNALEVEVDLGSAVEGESGCAH